MAKGGSRPGAGRKPGTVSEQTKRKLALVKQAEQDGVTPLEVMLVTMRSLWSEAIGEDGRVVDAAKAVAAHAIAKDAAPFLHPKLSQVSADVNTTISHEDALDDLR